MAKRDCLYPETGFRKDGTHELAAILRRESASNAPIVKIYQQLFDEWKNSGLKKMVISSEQFCGGLRYAELPPAKISLLREIFCGIDTRIVCYTREPGEMLDSLYNHTQRTRTSLWDHGVSYFYHNINLDFMYEGYLNLWRRFFGEENVISRSYEDAVTDTGIVTDFLSVLDIDNTGFRDVRPMNARFGKKALEALHDQYRKRQLSLKQRMELIENVSQENADLEAIRHVPKAFGRRINQENA